MSNCPIAAPGDASTDDVAGDPEHDGASILSAGLTQIRAVDKTFDEIGFIEGARVAYEMIVTSFANSDIDTLRPLVADEVYQNFASAIDTREERGENVETTILSIKSADIIEAGVRSTIAEVTVKFVTEMVSVTRNADGEVVAGDTRAVQDITDIWTFARSTKSSDPNWTLIETRSPQLMPHRWVFVAVAIVLLAGGRALLVVSSGPNAADWSGSYGHHVCRSQGVADQ